MHKHILVRLVTYYLALFAVLSALFYAFPVLGTTLPRSAGARV